MASRNYVHKTSYNVHCTISRTKLPCEMSLTLRDKIFIVLRNLTLTNKTKFI